MEEKGQVLGKKTSCQTMDSDEKLPPPEKDDPEEDAEEVEPLKDHEEGKQHGEEGKEGEDEGDEEDEEESTEGSVEVRREDFDNAIEVDGQNVVVVENENSALCKMGQKFCVFGSTTHVKLLERKIKELEKETQQPPPLTPAATTTAVAQISEERKRLIEEAKKLHAQVKKLKTFAQKGQIDQSKMIQADPSQHTVRLLLPFFRQGP